MTVNVLQFNFSDDPQDAVSSEEEEETAQEKRLRLAKQYLAELEVQGLYNFELKDKNISLFDMWNSNLQ